MPNVKPKLIVALDVETFEEARVLVEILSPAVDIFKVGSQLFTSCGPVVVRFIQAKQKEVFLDLKYHDIPNTVANAVGAAVKTLTPGRVSGSENRSILMYTMHVAGGEEMLRRAVESAQKTAQETGLRMPLALGITVLTSEDGGDNIQLLVSKRALLAKKVGLDGVVASVQEASMIRKECGDDFIIVTPGIRPSDADIGDQKRVATPALAVKNGSNFLVVGRPIVKAKDPLSAVKDILKEMARTT